MAPASASAKSCRKQHGALNAASSMASCASCTSCLAQAEAEGGKPCTEALEEACNILQHVGQHVAMRCKECLIFEYCAVEGKRVLQRGMSS